MLKLELFFGVLAFALGVFCLIEAISTPDRNIRNLPKVAWILLILFFPFVGSIAWLVAGRPQTAGRSPHERAVPQFPEYDRPGRAASTDPAKDEEFLRKVRERAEEQRAREAMRRRQEMDKMSGDEES